MWSQQLIDVCVCVRVCKNSMPFNFPFHAPKHIMYLLQTKKKAYIKLYKEMTWAFAKHLVSALLFQSLMWLLSSVSWYQLDLLATSLALFNRGLD